MQATSFTPNLANSVLIDLILWGINMLEHVLGVRILLATECINLVSATAEITAN